MDTVCLYVNAGVPKARNSGYRIPRYLAVTPNRMARSSQVGSPIRSVRVAISTSANSSENQPFGSESSSRLEPRAPTISPTAGCPSSWVAISNMARNPDACSSGLCGSIGIAGDEKRLDVSRAIGDVPADSDRLIVLRSERPTTERTSGAQSIPGQRRIQVVLDVEVEVEDQQFGHERRVVARAGGLPLLPERQSTRELEQVGVVRKVYQLLSEQIDHEGQYEIGGTYELRPHPMEREVGY